MTRQIKHIPSGGKSSFTNLSYRVGNKCFGANPNDSAILGVVFVVCKLENHFCFYVSEGLIVKLQYGIFDIKTNQAHGLVPLHLPIGS